MTVAIQIRHYEELLMSKNERFKSVKDKWGLLVNHNQAKVNSKVTERKIGKQHQQQTSQFPASYLYLAKKLIFDINYSLLSYIQFLSKLMMSANLNTVTIILSSLKRLMSDIIFCL